MKVYSKQEPPDRFLHLDRLQTIEDREWSPIALDLTGEIGITVQEEFESTARAPSLATSNSVFMTPWTLHVRSPFMFDL